MSGHSSDPDVEQPEDESGEDQEATGVEIGSTDGDGSTFEPEEDPEGHAS